MRQTNFSCDFPLVPELGVDQSWKSLFLLPHRYTDLSKLVTDFSRIHDGMSYVLVRGRVVGMKGLTREREETFSPYPGILVMTLSDGTNVIDCETFKPADWKSIERDDTITVLCKVRSFRGTVSLCDPEREKCRPQPRPEYKGIASKVAGERIMAAAYAAISDDDSVFEAAKWMITEQPRLARLIGKHWGTVESLLRGLHAPENMDEAREALQIARRVCVAEVRLKSRLPRKVLPSIPPNPELRRSIWDAIKSQPETFSESQLAALKAAVPALAGDKPSRVLINGDVGSGKTLVFLVIAAGFAKLGIHCAIMAPNGNVADQIRGHVMRRFPDIPCRYLGDGRDEGPADALIYVGTQALLHVTDRPKFGAVIVDEQQKFSRGQRQLLLEPHSHLIEATATPIPATLANALFGDCVIAKIPHSALQRVIRSHLFDNTQRAQVVKMTEATLARGKKVLFVYAAVNKAKAKVIDPDALPEAPPKPKAKKKGEKEEEVVKPKAPDARDATTAYEELQKRFPGQVAIVHGQMRTADRMEQMQAFHEGRLRILVSTTAVEVGVDSPGIGLVVVNDPDRMGLFQLHQMRGRGARDGGEADFVMFTKKALSKHAMQRLMTIRNTRNGFKLAEEDLKMRGFGEVAGDLQTGVAETTFKLNQLRPEDFVQSHR